MAKKEPINRETHPSVYAAIDRVAEHLGIDPPKTVLLDNSPAMVAAYDPPKDQFYISDRAIAEMSQEELTGLLAHELKHRGQRPELLKWETGDKIAKGIAAIALVGNQVDNVIHAFYNESTTANTLFFVATTCLYAGWTAVRNLSHQPRELEADQAAVAVVGPDAAADMLGKAARLSRESFNNAGFIDQSLFILKALIDHPTVPPHPSMLTRYTAMLCGDEPSSSAVDRLQAERAGNPDKDSPSR